MTLLLRSERLSLAAALTRRSMSVVGGCCLVIGGSNDWASFVFESSVVLEEPRWLRKRRLNEASLFGAIVPFGS